MAAEGYFHHQKTEERHGVKFSADERAAMEDIDGQISVLLEELRPNIENGKYKLVVGDDASGRVPALIIAGALKKIYAARGAAPPAVRFIAGSRNLAGEDLERKTSLLDVHSKNLKNKFLNDGNQGVLVVTDFISTGSSVKPIVDSLKKTGADVDLVTIGLADDFRWSKSGLKVAAAVNSFLPEIYNRTSLSGVRKQPGDLFATRSVRPGETEGQRRVNAAREMVRDIVDHVSEEFLSKLSAS